MPHKLMKILKLLSLVLLLILLLLLLLLLLSLISLLLYYFDIICFFYFLFDFQRNQLSTFFNLLSGCNLNLENIN